MERINLIGQRFGKLIVIKFVFKKNGNVCWECLCNCGNTTIVNTSNLRRKHTLSCGCLRKKRLLESLTKHGMSHTRFWNIWRNMRQRCFDENTVNYNRYGGRGIKVCNRWLKFKNFKDDMYKSYKEHVKIFGEKKTQIDRKNYNKNYYKKNCRWVNLFEQANNKKNNHFLTYNNQTLTISQWERKLGFNKDIVRFRINKSKWSVEKSLTTPVRKF
jgi:hypothetical protein